MHSFISRVLNKNELRKQETGSGLIREGKMRKKTVIAALGLSFMLAFAGCGSESGTNSRTGGNNKVNDVIQSQIESESSKSEDGQKTAEENKQEGTAEDNKNTGNDENGDTPVSNEQGENSGESENGNGGQNESGNNGQSEGGNGSQSESGNNGAGEGGQQETGDNGGSSETSDTPDYSNATPDLDNIDVDLTQLSSTMVYSEVYNMMMKPDDYLGKTVKMSGQSASYHDEVSGKYYFACVTQDATACCSQGIEYCLDSSAKSPEDYPEDGSEVTLVGVFDTYYEDNYRYMTLRNSVKME